MRLNYGVLNSISTYAAKSAFPLLPEYAATYYSSRWVEDKAGSGRR